jgi:hypothetical protein
MKWGYQYGMDPGLYCLLQETTQVILLETKYWLLNVLLYEMCYAEGFPPKGGFQG